MQAIRPRRGQSFYGEGRTVLNGGRLPTTFSREGRYWVASGQLQRGQKHGECRRDAPACSLPEGFFIDDKPLDQVLSKDGVEANRFYLDYASGRLYFADDPDGSESRDDGRCLCIRKRGWGCADQERDCREIRERRSRRGRSTLGKAPAGPSKTAKCA
jgi:hypothetical protein